jgi:hypothetical protein
MFTTLRMVAPAPGSPPKSPDTALPIPCPTSSLSLLCRRPVIRSTMTEVSSESMEPSSASAMAACATTRSCATSKSGMLGVGNPAGISPISGTSSPATTATTVARISATSAEGSLGANRRTSRIVASVPKPSPAAAGFISLQMRG